VRIRIEGHDLPGRDFSCDGVEHDPPAVTWRATDPS
jgi:hypothetical protein